MPKKKYAIASTYYCDEVHVTTGVVEATSLKGAQAEVRRLTLRDAYEVLREKHPDWDCWADEDDEDEPTEIEFDDPFHLLHEFSGGGHIFDGKQWHPVDMRALRAAASEVVRAHNRKWQEAEERAKLAELQAKYG